MLDLLETRSRTIVVTDRGWFQHQAGMPGLRAWICVPLAGCSLYFGDGVEAPMASDHVEVALVPVTINRNLDVLFVIQDSPGTLDLQANVKAAFPALVAELSAVEGGTPDL